MKGVVIHMCVQPASVVKYTVFGSVLLQKLAIQNAIHYLSK